MRGPDTYASNMEAAGVRPSPLLRGTRPRLIDEWQVAPVLWDAAVDAVDEADDAPTQFLLTGSATSVRADREDGVHVVLIGCLAH